MQNKGIKMKKLTVILFALAITASAATANAGANVQSVPDFVPYGTVEATLIRNNNSLTVDGTVYGLNPGETYTVWWVIETATETLIMNASGGIANRHGALSFGAALQTGSYEAGDDTPRVVFLGGTLADTGSATVIFDVLAHGSKIPGRVNEQISTLEAGCEPALFCPSVTVFGFGPVAP
jgi:hypothetical protein